MRWLLYGLLLAVSTNVAIAQTSSSSSKSKETSKSTAAEPLKYSGKTFEQWLKELSTKDPSRREDAVRAILMFPRDVSVKALPVILTELRKHNASTPVDLSVRCHFCIAIGELAGSGEKIDPKDLKQAITLLAFQMRDPQLILRYRAASALGSLGTEARGAIPDLVIMLNDPMTWEVRQAAAVALGRVANDGDNGPPAEVLKQLYGRLKDPAMQVRIASVQALSMLGPRPGKEELDGYVGALLPVATKDPEPGLQIWARVAIIGATQDFSTGSISPIVKHMASDDSGVRVQAIQAAGTIGQRAKLAVPGLTRSLTDTEPIVVASAMWALGRMETYAADAIPALRKISVDPNQSDYMKKAAKETVEKITGEKSVER